MSERVVLVTELNPKIKAVVEEMNNSAQRIFGDKLRKVILYGSYARGDYNEYSDLDIMVLADVEGDEGRGLKSEIHDVASDVGLDNDIIVSVMLNNETLFMSRLDISPFYQNVINEGVELYVAQ